MTLKKINISPAEISDLKDILDIQKSAFQYEAEIYDSNDLPPMTQSLESISEDFNKYNYFKATYNTEIIGSVRLKNENYNCFIGRLIVKPGYQKQGIGTLIMDFVENSFTDIKRFELFTGKRSERNIRFYKKRGYSIFAEFVESENIELVKMEKVVLV